MTPISRDEEKLEPCPFCGGTDSADNATEMESVLVVKRPTAIKSFGYKVACTCGCEAALCVTRELAIKVWNRRHRSPSAPQPPTISIVERARRLAESIPPAALYEMHPQIGELIDALTKLFATEFNLVRQEAFDEATAAICAAPLPEPPK